MADFEAEINLKTRSSKGSSNSTKKSAGGSAFGGAFVGSILGNILSSVKQLFQPIKAMATLLVAALFPILKPFLILFIKVGIMLYKFLNKILGGDRGPAASLSGTAGLKQEDIDKIKETGKKLGLSNEEVDKNIAEANTIEKKKNKVLATTGMILGGLAGIGAVLLAGFLGFTVGLPTLLIGAFLGAVLGLIAIVFGRDTADYLLGFLTEAFNYIKEAFSKFPRNIKAAWKAFIGLLSDTWDKVIKTLSEAFSGIGDIASSVWGWIKGLFKGTIDVAGQVWSFIKSLFSGGSGGGHHSSVNDAIITPNGDIIRTNPSDYLIATKNPDAIGGGGLSNVNVTITGGLITEEVARDIGKILQRELNLGGRF